MARRGQNEGCRYNSDKFRNDCFPCFPLFRSFMTLATSTPAHDRSMAADWRLCVAPMIDVTDRHCRFFHRLLAPRARLYTEMITTGALMHGDVARHLDFDPAEQPVALQLGGSEPDALAECARLGEQGGYEESNSNIGSPTEKSKSGGEGQEE